MIGELLIGLAAANLTHSFVMFEDGLPTVQEFLRELPRYEAVSNGTWITFSGDFRTIPSSLDADLRRHFPDHRFVVAKMAFVHWGPEPVDLVLVTSARNGRVESFAWSFWFDSPPSSFASILNRYAWGPYCEAEPSANAVAKLLAFASGYRLESLSKDDIFAGCPGVTCRWSWTARRDAHGTKPDTRIVVEVVCHRTVRIRFERIPT